MACVPFYSPRHIGRGCKPLGARSASSLRQLPLAKSIERERLGLSRPEGESSTGFACAIHRRSGYLIYWSRFPWILSGGTVGFAPVPSSVIGGAERCEMA